MTSVTTERVSLPRGQATVWKVDGGARGVFRLEQFDDCLALTWSTKWKLSELRRFIKHASGPARPGTMHVPLHLPATVDAFVVDKSGEKQEFSRCTDFLRSLHPTSLVTFVRIDIEEGALVWAKHMTLDGWEGSTLGVITKVEGESYTLQLILDSATDSIGSLRDNLAAALPTAPR